MILASSFLFSLNMPDGFATVPSDIGLYKGLVGANMLFTSPMFASRPRDAVAALQECI